MKKLFLIITIVLLLAMPVSSDYLTCDPQPSSVVTKYRIDLNGEILPAGIEKVGEDQVRIHYNIDHLSDGKHIVSAQAGNNKGEWSLPSEDLKFYQGVPTPQNIGLYCATEDPVRIPQENLSLYYFSSQEISDTHDRAAKYIIDGRADTIWVTDHSLSHPHEIQIDLGRSYMVSGLYILPRQDSGDWGRIKSYEVYVSVDGITWAKVKSGNFPLSKEEQLAKFDPVLIQYISIVGLSAYAATTISIAEINVWGY